MTSRPLVLVGAALGVLSLRLFACKPVPPRFTAQASPGKDAAATVLAPPEPDAGAARAFAPEYSRCTLLGNGHVFIPVKDILYDWDPFGGETMRKVRLGDAGPAHTFAFAPLGGRRFVVAKADELDNLEFELWDAEKLAFVRALGKYASANPVVEFDTDGKRLMLLGCPAPKDDQTQCEVGVHDLATGELVRRMSLPPLDTPDHAHVNGRLSPAGTFFAISVEDFAAPATIYDVASGRVMMRIADAASDVEEANEMPGIGLKFAFIDDQRLLTVEEKAGVRITNLKTGHAFKRPIMAGAKERGLRTVLSPNRDFVAIEMTRQDDTVSVDVIAVGTGVGHTVAIPKRVCSSSTCVMRWATPTHLVLFESNEHAALQFGIDVNSVKAGTGVAEPGTAPGPFEEFMAPSIQGDFDRYGATKWHAQDRSAEHPRGAIISPRGAPIDLASLDERIGIQIVAERLFVESAHRLRMYTATGEAAELINPRNPPP